LKGRTRSMTSITIEHHGRRRAYILKADGDNSTTRLATVYRMTDGWHAKLSDDHTQRAWSGPYGSVEEAAVRFAA